MYILYSAIFSKNRNRRQFINIIKLNICVILIIIPEYLQTLHLYSNIDFKKYICVLTIYNYKKNSEEMTLS